MFTGIIEATSTVAHQGNLSLDIATPLGWETEVCVGDSIAINGCCLTVAEMAASLRFRLSEETVSRTNLGTLQPGDTVNLERAMRANGRFDGHVVQGHVDGVGRLELIQPEPGSHVLTFSAPLHGQKWMIEKGSITVNGISLTLFNIKPQADRVLFSVSIIPHTWQVTHLNKMKLGDAVNLEFDLIAKYVENLVRNQVTLR